MDNISSKWATNESLLQSYRLIFITMQSVFVATGFFIYQSIYPFVALLIVSLIIIWFIWFPIVRSRHLVADYFKYCLRLSDNELIELKKVCNTEHEYVSDHIIRGKANVILKCKSPWRLTRIKLDLILPILFSTLWISMLFM